MFLLLAAFVTTEVFVFVVVLGEDAFDDDSCGDSSWLTLLLPFLFSLSPFSFSSSSFFFTSSAFFCSASENLIQLKQ